MQGKIHVKPYHGHEFRAVLRQRGKQHLEVVVISAVHLHEPGHLTGPVEHIAECQIQRERAAQLHRLEPRGLQAAHDDAESVHRAATRADVVLIGVLVRGIFCHFLIGLAAEEHTEIQREQSLIVAEHGVRLVSAVGVFCVTDGVRLIRRDAEVGIDSLRAPKAHRIAVRHVQFRVARASPGVVVVNKRRLAAGRRRIRPSVLRHHAARIGGVVVIIVESQLSAGIGIRRLVELLARKILLGKLEHARVNVFRFLLAPALVGAVARAVAGGLFGFGGFFVAHVIHLALFDGGGVRDRDVFARVVQFVQGSAVIARPRGIVVVEPLEYAAIVEEVVLVSAFERRSRFQFLVVVAARSPCVIVRVFKHDVACGDLHVKVLHGRGADGVVAFQRFVVSLVVKDEELAFLGELGGIVASFDRRISLLALAALLVIRPAVLGIFLHAGEHTVIVHIVRARGFALRELGKSLGRHLGIAFKRTEANLQTFRLLLRVEEVQSDAEVDEPVALVVEQGRPYRDVIGRRVYLRVYGKVGEHLLQRVRHVGRDEIDDQLQEARARFQRDGTREDVEEHRRFVGIRNGVYRRRHSLRGARRVLLAAAHQTAQHHVVEQGLQRIVRKIHFHLGGGPQDPAQIQIERGCVEDVVAVVVVADVHRIAHVIEPEHMGEGLVRLGAPQVYRKFQTRDIQGVVCVFVRACVVYHHSRADLEGQGGFIAVLHREQSVHVAEYRAEDVLHRGGAGGIHTVLFETGVRRVVPRHIVPSHESVLGSRRPAFRVAEAEVPILFGEIFLILADGDGAAYRQVDVVKLARVAVIDVFAVVEDGSARKVCARVFAVDVEVL